MLLCALYPMPVTLCLLFSSFLLAVALRRLFLEEGAGTLLLLVHLYMRIYNVALIASLVLSLALALRLRSDGISILCMFWLFGVAFFALWESHDRYSISFFFR